MVTLKVLKLECLDRPLLAPGSYRNVNVGSDAELLEM